MSRNTEQGNPAVEEFAVGFFPYLEQLPLHQEILLLMEESFADRKEGKEILEKLLHRETLLWSKRPLEEDWSSRKREIGWILAIGGREICSRGYQLSQEWSYGTEREEIPVIAVYSDSGWKSFDGRIFEKRMGEDGIWQLAYRGMRRYRKEDRIFLCPSEEEGCGEVKETLRLQRVIQYWEMGIRLQQICRSGIWSAAQEDYFRAAGSFLERGNELLARERRRQKTGKRDWRAFLEWESGLLAMPRGVVRLMAAPLELYYGMPWEWAVYYVLRFLTREGGEVAQDCLTVKEFEEGIWMAGGLPRERIEDLREQICHIGCFMPESFFLSKSYARYMTSMAWEAIEMDGKREKPPVSLETVEAFYQQFIF